MNYYSTNRRAAEACAQARPSCADWPRTGGSTCPGASSVCPSRFSARCRAFLSYRSPAAWPRRSSARMSMRTLCSAYVTDTLSFDAPVVRVEDRVWSLGTFSRTDAGVQGCRRPFHGPHAFLFSRARGRPRHGTGRHVGRYGQRRSQRVSGRGGYRRSRTIRKGRSARFRRSSSRRWVVTLRRSRSTARSTIVSGWSRPRLWTGSSASAFPLTSANSINVARFLPQAFYYFNAYARLREAGLSGPIVVSVPSGNFGNLTAGLFAKRMGLPVKRFIAANNRNDIFYHYLQTGNYEPPAVGRYDRQCDGRRRSEQFRPHTRLVRPFSRSDPGRHIRCPLRRRADLPGDCRDA